MSRNNERHASTERINAAPPLPATAQLTGASRNSASSFSQTYMVPTSVGGSVKNTAESRLDSTTPTPGGQKSRQDKKIGHGFCRSRSKKTQSKEDRTFYINDYQRNQIMNLTGVSNYISTTKYTMWNFVPLSLLYQFKREANFYFLTQAILNSIKAVSAMTPGAAYAPIVFILAVSMVREGIEDYDRYKADKMTNNQVVKIIKKGHVIDTRSSDINCGDIVLVEDEEFFPADMILLATSNEKATGLVKTSSLDGETAPKLKKVPKGLDWIIPSGGKRFSPDLLLSTGKCEIEAPNSNLYAFEGKLSIAHRKFSLGYEQLLLKGTQLTNTDWVIGFVAYTGQETRIMMNSHKGSLKQSDVEKMMNKFTIIIVTVMLVLTLVLSLLGGSWHADQTEMQSAMEQNFYIDLGYDSLVEGFFTFVRYFQLLSLLLPTSLFVSVEVFKAVIASLIANDIALHSLKHANSTKVQNMSIVEDLGMIHYIFADKTGTLTCNKMEFHSLCIGATEFGRKETLSDSKRRSSFKRQGSQNQEDTPVKEEGEFDLDRFEMYIKGEMHPDEEPDLELRSENGCEMMTITSQKDLMEELMTGMSLNHQCIRVRKKSKLTSNENTPKEKVYQGTSPDEITLVKFAKDCGFQFMSGSDHFIKLKMVRLADLDTTDLDINNRQNETFNDVQHTQMSLNQDSRMGLTHNASERSFDTIMQMEFDRSTITMPHPKRPDERIFQILSRMDFTSERRRMSILVRDPKDQLIKLYVKGADDVIRERLDFEAQDPNIVTKVENFVKETSRKGLRTLLFAMKILDEDEVQIFQEKLSAIHDTKVRDRQKEEELFSKLESDLTLLGATAVEDKLQDDVPEVIQDLQDAQIKVWMLTGDKFETAENIAKSCKLIQSNFEIFRMQNRTDVAKYCSDEFVAKNESLVENQVKRALMIENVALSHIMENSHWQDNFIRISKSCEAVVCCRLRPGQKADVIRMIKMDDKSALTLAIGDGANDVSMIKEAHVGVGIFGNEGNRAVQASDFALPEFRMLRRLLLYHGRARYISISKFILYFFYKNAVVSMPQFFFAYFNAYSAMVVFDEYYIQGFNTLFTSIPPGALAVIWWDIAVDIDGPQYDELLPKLYQVGQWRQKMNVKRFLMALAQALFDGAVIFFICFQPTTNEYSVTTNGQISDMWVVSVTAFTAIVFVTHFNLFTRLNYMTYVHAIAIFGCSIGLYLVFFLFSQRYFRTQRAVFEALKSTQFYMQIFVCIGICFFADYAYDCWDILIRQSPTDHLRWLIASGKDIEEPAQRAHFDFLVEREEDKARRKNSRARTYLHQRQLLMRQRLTEIQIKKDRQAQGTTKGGVRTIKIDQRFLDKGDTKSSKLFDSMARQQSRVATGNTEVQSEDEITVKRGLSQHQNHQNMGASEDSSLPQSNESSSIFRANTLKSAAAKQNASEANSPRNRNWARRQTHMRAQTQQISHLTVNGRDDSIYEQQQEDISEADQFLDNSILHQSQTIDNHQGVTEMSDGAGINLSSQQVPGLELDQYQKSRITSVEHTQTVQIKTSQTPQYARPILSNNKRPNEIASLKINTMVSSDPMLISQSNIITSAVAQTPKLTLQTKINYEEPVISSFNDTNTEKDLELELARLDQQSIE